MQKTVIAHFYNEEYLLPWWLEHHKKIFDHGVLINYASTDRSVEICRDICPKWQVFDSINAEFHAPAVDAEVQQYENQLWGWKMALNITEFLVGDVDRLLHHEPVETQYIVPSIAFFDWNPEGILNRDKKLWDQIKIGLSYKKDFWHRRGRSIHNFPFNYNDIGAGRHFKLISCIDMLVFHYADAISSPEMLKRRLQVQHRIPMSDKLGGMGIQHHNNCNDHDINSLYEFQKQFDSKIEDCSGVIEQFTKFYK